MEGYRKLAALAGVDSLRSGMTVRIALFCLLFIAKVTLHILHKHVCSMAVEAATLVVLFYGAGQGPRLIKRFGGN